MIQEAKAEPKKKMFRTVVRKKTRGKMEDPAELMLSFLSFTEGPVVLHISQASWLRTGWITLKWVRVSSGMTQPLTMIATTGGSDTVLLQRQSHNYQDLVQTPWVCQGLLREGQTAIWFYQPRQGEAAMF